jgi:hypothetical protein
MLRSQGSLEVPVSSNRAIQCLPPRDAASDEPDIDDICLRRCGMLPNRFHGVDTRNGILLHRDGVLLDVGEVRPRPRGCLDGRYRSGPTRTESSCTGTGSVPTRTGASYMWTVSSSTEEESVRSRWGQLRSGRHPPQCRRGPPQKRRSRFRSRKHPSRPCLAHRRSRRNRRRSQECPQPSRRDACRSRRSS